MHTDTQNHLSSNSSHTVSFYMFYGYKICHVCQLPECQLQVIIISFPVVSPQYSPLPSFPLRSIYLTVLQSSLFLWCRLHSAAATVLTCSGYVSTFTPRSNNIQPAILTPIVTYPICGSQRRWRINSSFTRCFPTGDYWFNGRVPHSLCTRLVPGSILTLSSIIFIVFFVNFQQLWCINDKSL